MIRLFLFVTTILLIGWTFKQEIIIAYLKYMAMLKAKEYYKNIKEQVDKQLEPINKYWQPVYSVLSNISGSNLILTPLNFIKYSCGYIIFSFAYLLSNIIDGINYGVNFIGGMFTNQGNNSNINNNSTSFANNGTESGL